MAELTDSTEGTAVSTCCAPEQQADCCEPADKAECCSAESSSCGCSAGQSDGEGERGGSARPAGHSYGLDMTDEMLALARENQRQAGVENVECGCIAGALTRREFEQALLDAGLVDVEITETHRVHDCAGSAIVRARKPS